MFLRVVSVVVSLLLTRAVPAFADTYRYDILLHYRSFFPPPAFTDLSFSVTSNGFITPTYSPYNPGMSFSQNGVNCSENGQPFLCDVYIGASPGSTYGTFINVFAEPPANYLLGIQTSIGFALADYGSVGSYYSQYVDAFHGVLEYSTMTVADVSTPSPVPEPGTFFLLLTGTATLLCCGRRRILASFRD